MMAMTSAEKEYDKISIDSEEIETDGKIVDMAESKISGSRSRFCGFGMTRIRKGINLHKSEEIPENEYSGYREGWKGVYQVIFESSTTRGQAFDITLLTLIAFSVTAAVLDSVRAIREDYGHFLLSVEIIFTFIFTAEYALRVVCILKPREYLCSMIGIIDLSSIIPTYLAAFIPSARPLIHLAVLRVLRILRVFRVLKLVRFVDEAQALSQSMRANQRRIAVFLFAVFTLILVIGCAMYLIEGETHGFSSIPMSLYWTVVTLTTVGYGDIAPQTVIGRVVATFVMLAGYGIIACPLVLVNNQLSTVDVRDVKCSRCLRKNHQADAVFCRICGCVLLDPRIQVSKPNRDLVASEGNMEEKKCMPITSSGGKPLQATCA